MNDLRTAKQKTKKKKNNDTKAKVYSFTSVRLFIYDMMMVVANTDKALLFTWTCSAPQN